MAESNSTADSTDIALRSSIDRSLRHPVMFFFTSGALWLALAIVLGLVASAKKHHPEFLTSFPWLDAGKVDAAHMTALLYGWGAQAAFGMIIWLMARLSRKECTSAGIILLAGHLWNAMIMYGVVKIMMGLGSGIAFMELPKEVWPVMIFLYGLIAVWSLVQFQVRDAGHVYVSQWYLLAALMWFPWIMMTSWVLVFVMDTHLWLLVWHLGLSPLTSSSSSFQPLSRVLTTSLPRSPDVRFTATASLFSASGL